MIASDSTVIRTLRIRTATPDRLAARQQTERALQAASLRPIGLSRDAILIVRQIKSRHAGAAGWEQVVNAQLDQLARQAARPIDGAVPAAANAVIFADRSELLACLAAAWRAGVVRAQWWWQSLLRHDDLTRSVIEAWLATPEYIPLALHRLFVRQQAIDFVQQLSDDHARRLLRALVETFGLYELSIRLAEISEREPEGHDVIAQHNARATSTLPGQMRPVPPWQPGVQTHDEHLSFDRQVLLGVGLMLHTAPSIVRSASFAFEVKAWHTAIRMAQQQQPAPSDSTPVPTYSLSSSATVELEAPHQEETPDIHSASAEVPTEPTVPPSSREGRRPTKPSPARQPEMPTDDERTARPSASPQTVAALPSTLAVTEVEHAQVEIETKFGGVCYFINLGQFLNLYGDFTTPLQPGLDLPIWDFVALVAQELIGDDVTHDPIWPLLAQLADRAEDEPPGAHFKPARNAASRNDDSDMTPLDIWLADLMSIIRPRLQVALDVSAEELPRYFKQPARIAVSVLNFDAYFALADLPIEIRLSGLDRDPGWVPAAGRTVRFHYD